MRKSSLGLEQMNHLNLQDQNGKQSEADLYQPGMQGNLAAYSPDENYPNKKIIYLMGSILVLTLLYLFSRTLFSDGPEIDSPSQSDWEDDSSFSFEHIETHFEGKETEKNLMEKAYAEASIRINSRQSTNSYQNSPTETDDPEVSQVESLIADQPKDRIVQKDKYFFGASIKQVILASHLKRVYRQTKIDKISKRQHIRAVIRTQLTHSINSKGQVAVVLSHFDVSNEEKSAVIKKILTDEEIYYESVYGLSQYSGRELRFCIVVPSYNNIANKLYLRNLDSIFMQNYSNYHVVYIDDHSPENTSGYVAEYIKANNISYAKIKLIRNPENRKAMSNIYEGVHQHCEDGQIVALIDGDDSLIGTRVLKLYNAIYQKHRAAMVYSNFLKILHNNQTSFGFGKQISKKFFWENGLRKDISLVGSHLLTFYADAFKMIERQDFCYSNGTYFDYAYDRAIVTPLVQIVYPHIYYLPEMTYEYRNDTGLNDGTKEWEKASRIIMAQQKYEPLSDFSFISDAIDKAETV